jgi:hypothetical protein
MSDQLNEQPRETRYDLSLVPNQMSEQLSEQFVKYMKREIDILAKLEGKYSTMYTPVLYDPTEEKTRNQIEKVKNLMTAVCNRVGINCTNIEGADAWEILLDRAMKVINEENERDNF